jgi:hypothetical protein
MRWSIAPTDEFVDVWIPTDEFVGVWIPWSIAPTDEFVGVWIPGCLDSSGFLPTSSWVSGFLA